MSRNFHFSAIAWRSELGLHRDGNEDSGLFTSNLIAVADGMGGYAGGEIASKIVIKTLADLIPVLTSAQIDNDSRDDLLRTSLIDMDSAIQDSTIQRPELTGMGTTFTSFQLIGDQLSLLHVGDSRAYRIRGKKITQLSRDHTVVQELIDQGRITPDEVAEHPQRSFLTQALMGKMNIDPILLKFPVEVGDIYFVCSDGLTNVVDEGKILAAFSDNLQDSVNSLIDLTYKNGAPDNVTVVAARVGETEAEFPITFIGAAQ